jgi:hypothetical protein
MKFEIQGVEKVMADIKRLHGDKMKRQEILKILRRQSKPLLAAIKANTPVADKTIQGRKGQLYEPQNLKKSMAIKTSPVKNYPNVLIGPRKGERAKNDGFYAFFIQYGHGNVPEDDFIAKATSPLLSTIGTVMSSELEKYIDKKIKTLNL